MKLSGRETSITVDGITVCYDDFGAGNTVIIFIHGFPFDKSSWKPQMDDLRSSYRVIAYDIRGFGDTTSNAEHASIDLFADDLVKFMDAIHVDKAIVCGLSMGGYILLNAVSRYPEKFEAIILSDTQCIADTAEAKEKRYKTIQQIEASGLNDFAEGFIKNAFCKDSLNDKKKLVEKIKKVILSTSPATITGTLAALAIRSETCSALTKISIPALILCGKEDAITPLAQSEFIQCKIKDSIFHTIERAGHLSNLEQPDEFNRQLDAFLVSLTK